MPCLLIMLPSAERSKTKVEELIIFLDFRIEFETIGRKIYIYSKIMYACMVLKEKR